MKACYTIIYKPLLILVLAFGLQKNIQSSYRLYAYNIFLLCGETLSSRKKMTLLELLNPGENKCFEGIDTTRFRELLENNKIAIYKEKNKQTLYFKIKNSYGGIDMPLQKIMFFYQDSPNAKQSKLGVLLLKEDKYNKKFYFEIKEEKVLLQTKFLVQNINGLQYLPYADEYYIPCNLYLQKGSISLIPRADNEEREDIIINREMDSALTKLGISPHYPVNILNYPPVHPAEKEIPQHNIIVWNALSAMTMVGGLGMSFYYWLQKKDEKNRKI
jgi:hypothetical protein